MTAAGMFAVACGDYYTAGWAGVMPIPPGAKYPPPEGYTGDEGAYPTPEQVTAWAAEHADWSVALRMPDGIIGIDVDQYTKHGTAKNGAATIREREAEWGPLPATWSSTARGSDDGPGLSRIMFFRVPAGRYTSRLPDVEIIQRHHRYAMVAPSVNPETGSPYRWYDPDGRASGRFPAPGELSLLPAAWVRGLAEGASSASPAAGTREAGHLLLAELEAANGLRCISVTQALTKALAECGSADPGSRHDLMTEHAYQMIMLGSEGHPGVSSAISELRSMWAAMMEAEPARLDEFERMLLTAARKAVTKNGPSRGAQDPCTGMFGLTYQAPAPGGEVAGEVQQPVMPELMWSPYSAIGTHEFSTRAMSDALLARDVLERAYPVIRYCPDAGAWIIRGPEYWTVRKGELGKWAVSLLHPLMQRGDAEAEKGSPEYEQAKRYGRFVTDASAGAIARQAAAQVLAGYHPCACELADLDQDHEILWAGGMAYDLRRSADGPAFAPVEPGIPHIHSAGVVPETRETPLWDKFLTAVWPDEEVRAWALRVLSIAFTGYSDKALPILLGDTNRGKTQVIALLMSVLGSYAHAADSRLLSPADRSHASIVYALKGRRLSFIDEAPRAGQLAQERLKQLTGGAELTGNRMGENPVTFLPTHTLILTANPEHEPQMNDNAVRSRVRLIPCDGNPAAVSAARAAIGTLNGPAWRREAPGVLARMMGECARYLADPDCALTDRGPLSARMAADELAASQDLPGTWLAEECEHWEAGTRSRELYAMFTESCRRMAVPPHSIPSETRWGRRVTELGYPPQKTMHANLRLLRVRPYGVQLPIVESSPGSMEGSPGFMEGYGGSETEPSITENVRSGPVSLRSMEGMEGQSPIITYTHTRTHTHAGEMGKPSITLQPSITLHGGVSFDLETGPGDRLFTYPRGEFVRLAGAVTSGEPAIITVERLLEVLAEAPEISGHNVLGFDLLALEWHHGADYDSLAAKAIDTELVARQENPPRSRDTHSADGYGLDAVAQRLGLPGKTDDLQRLARRHKGWDKIPQDDPEYRAYLEGDLRASLAVLEAFRPAAAQPYVRREHQLAALAGRMSLNGFLVDQDLLAQRQAETREESRAALRRLADEAGLPLARTVMRGRGAAKAEYNEELESPLSSDSGRSWLESTWQRFGVSDPPRTPKTGKLSVGAADLRDVAKRYPHLSGLCELIITAAWPRVVYKTAAECLASDGRVHPRVSMRQASGRWSVTEPGLTVFGKHGGRHRERDIFIPDDGHVLLAFDLSQVDMRAIAGHSQDPSYMALFAPGKDAHAEIAAQVGLSRQSAKAIGHGWNYGLGAGKMIKNGLNPDSVYAFLRGMEQRFPQLIAWREQIREQGKAGQILDNGFGRRMRCDPDRAYTVAPALMGQGGARDIMCESLLRLPRETWPMLRTMVHDEVVMSVPKDQLIDVAQAVKRAMTWEWHGVPVLCDMTTGANWGDASVK